MKHIKWLFLITLLILMPTCNAAPLIYSDGTGSYSAIVYLAQNDFFNFYATQDSIDVTLNSTTFPQDGFWSLNIFLEPKRSEDRENIIKLLNDNGKNPDYFFMYTPSGSRHFWALNQSMWYQPKDNTITSAEDEDFINDNGEILCTHTVKINVWDLTVEGSKMAIVNEQIINYLRQIYNKSTGYAN